MKIKVKKEKDDKLILEVDEERHTIPSLICWALLKDNDVEEASYTLDHPIVGEPEIRIKGKNPRKSLEKARKRIGKELDPLKLEETHG